jgi:Heparinase II/III-like protein/Heparinase II/III N-terminus
MATAPEGSQLQRAGRLRPLVAVAVALIVAIALVLAFGPGSLDPPRASPGPPVGTPSGTSIAAGASATPAPGSKASTATPATPSPPAPSPAARLLREGCRPGAGDSLARANDMLANRYTFSNMPTVALPADPRWNESPLKSRNWEFQYHTLRFVWDLTAAFEQTGDARYLDRAGVLLRDWVEDNPRRGGRSVFSWNDHATAWRAVVLVCAAELLPREPWLEQAVLLHGRTLADPAFYVRHGNHALNQSVGLLEVGCRVGRRDWMDLAATRLDGLVRESVDDEGVTNEQSVFYELYNWANYDRARQRLAACEVPEPASLARIDRMPEFLAHATLPNGEYAMLGATPQRKAMSIPGTIAEYAASQGVSGPRPTSRFAIFEAGFAFGRSGWGEERPFGEEVAWSARFGPGLQWHGHADGLSVTLYGHGSRLLEDAGVFTYNNDPWQRYALGRAAHNVVTVDGLAYNAGKPTVPLAHSTSATIDHLVLRNRGVAGVDHIRRIVFSPRLGYMLVEDRLTADVPRTFRQLWHLVADGDPVIEDGVVRTRRDHGNVAIVQLLPTSTPRIVVGRTDPVQGWFSRRLEDRTPAPVVEVPRRGRSVRYLTLLLPSAGQDAPYEVRDRVISPGGFSLTITFAGMTERVTVEGEEATIRPVG